MTYRVTLYVYIVFMCICLELVPWGSDAVVRCNSAAECLEKLRESDSEMAGDNE